MIINKITNGIFCWDCGRGLGGSEAPVKKRGKTMCATFTKINKK